MIRKWKYGIGFMMIITMVMAITGTGIAVTVGANEFGVRAAGMGGAFTAVPGNVASLFYNPAGIGQRAFELKLGGAVSEIDDLTKLPIVVKNDLSYSDAMAMAGYHSLNGAVGAGLGALAVGAKLDSLVIVHEYSEGIRGEIFAERDLAAGIGLDILKSALVGVRLGVAGHYLMGNIVEYDIDDTNETITKNGEQPGSGYYFTAGALANITPWITLGFSANKLGYTYAWEGQTTPSKAAPIYTVGAAVKLPVLGAIVAADYNNEESLRYGAEANLLFNLLSLRYGQIQYKDMDPITTVGASVNFAMLSAGVAVQTVPGGSLSEDDIERFTVEGTFRF